MDIQTIFDDSTNVYIVSMPKYITLEALRIWSQFFLKILEERSRKVGLLLDTNLHEFESVECLKFLREFLTNKKQVKSRISRVAFVQPLRSGQPEIISNNEAYFSDIGKAHKWLHLNSR